MTNYRKAIQDGRECWVDSSMRTQVLSLQNFQGTKICLEKLKPSILYADEKKKGLISSNRGGQIAKA
jgi:hypothetical protein